METISTLRYAGRAKSIENRTHINDEPKDALLRHFQEEIAELKKQLEEGAFDGISVDDELEDDEEDDDDDDEIEVCNGQDADEKDGLKKQKRRKSKVKSDAEVDFVDNVECCETWCSRVLLFVGDRENWRGKRIAGEESAGKWKRTATGKVSVL